LKIYILLLGLLILVSCAFQKSSKTTPVSKSAPSENYFLPGIDSSVVNNAVQFSDRLMVDFDRRKQADLLYEKGNNFFQSAESLWNYIQSDHVHDSIVIQIAEHWMKKYDVSSHKSQWTKESSFDKFNQVCLAVLDSAYKKVSQAKLCNPFDLDVRSLLIKIYVKQGEISHDTIYYTRAIEELNKFLLVDKSNPYIYEKLGECFYALRDWENSYRFFHDAEQILRIVAKFKYETNENATAALDTNRWIFYLRRQGEAKARLHDAEHAILFLGQAKELTSSNEIKQEFQDILDWINWDEGNIRAAEIRDEILQLEQVHNYKEARAQYLELLKILKTLEAKNEINWKIASLDYNLLGRKNEALKRLFQVIQNIRQGCQEGPLHKVYLKDYAAMCYSVGMDHVNNNNYRLAYIYLNQASEIEWNHKGDCFFQLAVLSRENPVVTIVHCNDALRYADQLSTAEINSIYEILAVSYKRKGEFDTANQYFQKWVIQNNAIKN